MKQYSEAKTTLLIVDDEQRNRELIESFLERDAYELYMAESGAEALLLAEGTMPDLILLDVMMPDMDGYEVCRRIRAQSRLATIPIIMVTALDGRDSRLEGLDAGADEFLTKPVDSIELRTRVRTVARLNRVRRLQQEREDFEMIAEDSRDGYLRVDRAGQVTYMNRASKQLLGRETVDRLLVRLKESFSLEPSGAWSDWDSVWRQPDTLRYLLRPATDSACAQWLRFEIKSSMGYESSARLCQITDVTPLMQTKRDTWSFQSAVCHKLRTPLTGIVAVTQMLAERQDPDPELLELLKTATGRLETQVKAVTQLVEYPRLLSAGTISHEDLVAAVRRSAALFGLRRLEEELSEVPDKRIELSEGAVEVITTALFENAVRFHPENCPVVTMSSSMTGGMYCLTFTDDGVRVPPDDLEKLGGLMFQSEPSFTGEVPGMGAGLVMVDSMIRERNGSLSFSNRNDAPGFVVSIAVPVTSEKVQHGEDCLATGLPTLNDKANVCAD